MIKNRETIKKNMPKITVLMSVYNGEKYLRKAIESILNQTYGNFEFLIINDGSTDSSAKIVHSYQDSRIHFINNHKNIGLTKSLNKGLALAKGEYIARQDADDISNLKRFEKQVNYLERNSEVVLLGTQARIINSKGFVSKIPNFRKLPTNEISIRWYCMINNPFIHSSIMIRRKIIWGEYGGYNNSFITSQDYELWSRIVYTHVCRNLKESLVDFRWHRKNISSNYTPENMIWVGKIYQQAIKNGLGKTINKEWINQWIIKNHPKWYSEKINIDWITKKIELMFEQFCYNNNINDYNKELFLFKQNILFKIVFVTANTDKLKSIKLFFKICIKDIYSSCQFAPRYFIKLILDSKNYFTGKR